MSKTKHYDETATRFSRAWWFAAWRNLLWAALVTVLIWVYADVRHAGKEEISATIELTTDSHKDMVILSQPRIPITFKIAGSRNNLERFKKKYDKSVISFDVSEDYTPGNNIAIPAVKMVEDLPALEELELSVISALPETIKGIHMGRLIVRQVPVEFVHSGAVLAEPARIEPPRVNIRVTETDWAKILNAQPKPAIRTKNVDLGSSQPGKIAELKNVKLDPVIAGLLVFPDKETETVDITAKIAQHTDTKTITVNVEILSPPQWAQDGTWQEFTLVRKDQLQWQPKITVTGPKTDLGRLEDKKKQVHAYVVLSDRHKKPIETWESEAVQIVFPPELKLNLVGEAPKVMFRIEPRRENSATP